MTGKLVASPIFKWKAERRILVSALFLIIYSTSDDTLGDRVVFSPQLRLSVNILINTSRDIFPHDSISDKAVDRN